MSRLQFGTCARIFEACKVVFFYFTHYLVKMKVKVKTVGLSRGKENMVISLPCFAGLLLLDKEKVLKKKVTKASFLFLV